ncbi:MAG TPA: hypothetical protein VFZ65_15915 [Planctomycetota bacterium]|nr:hypothetical protein [Planctomycetota bacterium]
MIARATATFAALAALVVPIAGQAPEPTPSEPAWTFGATAYTYFVPDDRDYVQPTFTADRDWLHLELRYNYESLDTASAWAGYNLGFGDELTVELTPMLGAVFGDTNGVAPGYEATLGWRRLELYSEGEYVFDTDDSSDSFFYNWSELTLTPVESFRFGIVTQRTRAYDSERDLQRGLLLGYSGKTVDVSAIVFNPDDARPIWVFSLGLGF